MGDEGQARLAASHALVVGLGALGCVSADLLARAGVGTLTLIDRDLVDRTNLHRQTLYTDDDARRRRPKALAARDRLALVNPGITIDARVMDCTPARARRLLHEIGSEEIGPPRVIVDGTDNFETRYLLNDLAVRHAVPFVYGGAVGTSGRVGVFLPDRGPCLRCLAPDPPAPGSQPTCQSAGVIAPASAMVGAAQAGEALKILLGLSAQISREILGFDLWDNTRSGVAIDDARDPACPCCAGRTFAFLDARHDAPESLCGRDAIQLAPRGAAQLDLGRIAAALGVTDDTECGIEGGEVVRGPVEHAGAMLELIAFRDGRAIIEGTDDPALARSIYDRYIGT